MINFQFADLHCHPTLKTFGHSFSKSKRIKNKKSNLWFAKPPSFINKCIQKLTGITKFSQTDFQTMAHSNVKLAFVSLYPFEKGFFTNPNLDERISAILSSFVTSIGYNRVRHIQKHKDYFKDLMAEYEFLIKSAKTKKINGVEFSWDFASLTNDIESNLKKDNFVSVIPTIEGAHVFNTGLSEYGKLIDEDEILNNVSKVKNLLHPPLFITFAHNFNNDLCGHAPSLEPLGTLVDQSKNLNSGFTPLGLKVINALLHNSFARPIYIDIKHMSLKARLEYYDILKTEYNNSIPIIVSHGGVTGRNTLGKITSTLNPEHFANDSINFYDEELIIIAKSRGLFAIQLDAKRLAPNHLIKKSLFRNNKKSNLKHSALIIWRQLQHIAEILDAQGIYAWGTCCIGSDFDGTINPLDGIWTSLNLNEMANELVMLVTDYLSKPNALTLGKNKNISAETIVYNFTINNTLNFIKNYY